MYFLLQASIIFAVCASNIRWHWTPNGYLAGLIGVDLAYGLTRLISTLRTDRALNAPVTRAESTHGHSMRDEAVGMTMRLMIGLFVVAALGAAMRLRRRQSSLTWANSTPVRTAYIARLRRRGKRASQLEASPK
jgi:hypothetical protein